MMLRGRHRGLPYALDRAINLPSDLVTEDEADKYKDDETESAAVSQIVHEETRLERGRRLMRSLTQ